MKQITLLILLSALCACPLQAQSATPSFNVRSFGAVGDGKHDDGPAFRQAIKKAQASGGAATVLIPSGRYRIATTEQVSGSWRQSGDKSGDKSGKKGTPGGGDATGRRLVGHLIVHNANDLTIAGERGSTLLMGNPRETGLAVVASKNVTLRGFAIDYDPLPFTQGKIVAANPLAGTFDLRLDPGYGDAGDEIYRGKNVIWRAMLFDPDTRQYDFRFPDYKIVGAERLDERTWRMRVANRVRALAQLSAGPLAVVQGRYSGSPAVRFFFTSDSLIDGVTVHTAPGGAFNLRASDGITLRRCAVAPPDDGNRLLSTNADGVHVKHNRRGPTIEFCRFLRQGADAINIGTHLASVVAQEGADTLVFDFLPENTRPGDMLQFIDSASGNVLGKSQIDHLEVARWRGDSVVRAKLKSPFKIPHTAEAMGIQRVHRGPPIKRSQLERRIPVLAVVPDVVGGAVVRNNTMSNHHARGILIRGSQATIENNTFEHLIGPAIIAGFELNFTEGPGVENLTIRRNTFRDIALTNILVANTGLGNYRLLSGAGGSRDITIQGNSFSGSGARVWRKTDTFGRYITVSSAENVDISDNKFEPGASPGGDKRASIMLIRARGAKVHANSNGSVVESSTANP